jgi:hypothetical protein
MAKERKVFKLKIGWLIYDNIEDFLNEHFERHPIRLDSNEKDRIG